MNSLENKIVRKILKKLSEPEAIGILAAGAVSLFEALLKPRNVQGVKRIHKDLGEYIHFEEIKK